MVGIVRGLILLSERHRTLWQDLTLFFYWTALTRRADRRPATSHAMAPTNEKRMIPIAHRAVVLVDSFLL